MGWKARRASGRSWAAKNEPVTEGTATKRDGNAGEDASSSSSSHGPCGDSWESAGSESEAARGQMAKISTGKESDVHSVALWRREAQTKQAPVLRASQHSITLARTAAAVMTVSQQEAACPR